MRCPILVGGAALSNRFTRLKIAPEYEGVVAYAKDAMTGLDLANQLMDATTPRRPRRASWQRETTRAARRRRAPRRRAARARRCAAATRAAGSTTVPTPPDLKLHVLSTTTISTRSSATSTRSMLYTRHLGFKGKLRRGAGAPATRKALELREQVRAVEDEMLRAARHHRARRCSSSSAPHREGETLHHPIAATARRCSSRFHFGRQTANEGLCLADFTLPRADAGAPTTSACSPPPSAPASARSPSSGRTQGEYLRSHILQVLALEGAEAFAELLHQKIREMWGIRRSARARR